jgi:hypothetical protein
MLPALVSEAFMRNVVLLVAILLGVSVRAAAAPLLFVEFLNSDLTFGDVNPQQIGHDLSSLAGPRALDWDSYGSTWSALGGPLVEHTFSTSGGTIVSSEYTYEGGFFSIDFLLQLGHRQKFGSFVAPITKLVISVQEDEEFDASVSVSYLLGAGMFDGAIARALGVRRRTAGGDVFSGLLLTGGDANTPERTAQDGFADVNLEVSEAPEPTGLMAVPGLSALWFWHRHRSRSRRRRLRG